MSSVVEYTTGVDQMVEVEAVDYHIRYKEAKGSTILVLWKGPHDESRVEVYFGLVFNPMIFVGVRKVAVGKLLRIENFGDFINVHFVPFQPVGR